MYRFKSHSSSRGRGERKLVGIVGHVCVMVILWLLASVVFEDEDVSVCGAEL